MNQTKPTLNLVTERELAKAMTFGEFGIRELRKQGKIPVVKLGYRTLRYDLDEVAKALKKLTTEVA